MNFSADSADCACLNVQTLGSERRSFLSAGRYVNEFIQVIPFFERSSFKLRFETYRNCTVIVIKHVAFFDICAKLTMAFTFATLPLNFYTCFRIWLRFRIEQKYWRIDGFGRKKVHIGGFA